MAAAAKRVPPFAFVLDELAESRVAPQVRTRPMFGALAVYVGERIVFILRYKQQAETSRDDGVWVVLQPEHIESFTQEFPIARRIAMFESYSTSGFSGWWNLPADDDAFEESVLRACRLVIQGDPRIGKVPTSKRRRATKKRA